MTRDCELDTGLESRLNGIWSHVFVSYFYGFELLRLVFLSVNLRSVFPLHKFAIKTI